MRLDLARKSARLAIADVDLGARIAFAKEWYWHHFGHRFGNALKVRKRGQERKGPGRTKAALFS